MAAFGLVAVERGRDPGDEGSSFELWPENVQSLRLWLEVATQWRVGMGGATGLDYNALPPVASMLGMKRREIPEVFHDIRVMEAEAMLVMSESK